MEPVRTVRASAQSVTDSYLNDRCPLCQGKRADSFQVPGHGDTNTYDIDTCSDCGFVYVRHVPSYDSIANIYQNMLTLEQGYVPDTKLHKKLTSWLLAKKIRYYTKSDRKRLLEIGYGEGHLLKALQREGVFDLEGIDSWKGSLPILKSLGLNVTTSSLEEKQYPEGHFDMVVAMHVLEHVQGPHRFIGEIHRILAPGGRVYLQVPTVAHWRARRAGQRWKHFIPPVHLWYFAPKTMRRFLSQHGFRVIFAHCISNHPYLTVLAERA